MDWLLKFLDEHNILILYFFTWQKALDFTEIMINCHLYALTCVYRCQFRRVYSSHRIVCSQRQDIDWETLFWVFAGPRPCLSPARPHALHARASHASLGNDLPPLEWLINAPINSNARMASLTINPNLHKLNHTCFSSLCTLNEWIPCCTDELMNKRMNIASS